MSRSIVVLSPRMTIYERTLEKGPPRVKNNEAYGTCMARHWLFGTMTFKEAYEECKYLIT